jgi:hypothetical protein
MTITVQVLWPGRAPVHLAWTGHKATSLWLLALEIHIAAGFSHGRPAAPGRLAINDVVLPGSLQIQDVSIHDTSHPAAWSLRWGADAVPLLQRCSSLGPPEDLEQDSDEAAGGSPQNPTGPVLHMNSWRCLYRLLAPSRAADGTMLSELHIDSLQIEVTATAFSAFAGLTHAPECRMALPLWAHAWFRFTQHATEDAAIRTAAWL